MSCRKGSAGYARNVDIDVKLNIQQITVTKRGRPDRRVAFCMRDFGDLV